MRNILEYPITTKEIIECLEELKKECDPNLIGDMRPLLLDEAIKAVRHNVLLLHQK